MYSSVPNKWSSLSSGGGGGGEGVEVRQRCQVLIGEGVLIKRGVVPQKNVDTHRNCFFMF